MPEYHSFAHLRQASKAQLLDELTQTQEDIANLHLEVAFLRSEKARGPKDSEPLRLQREGDLKAMEEKKWLIIKLVDNASE